MPGGLTVEELLSKATMDDELPEVRLLYHKLNNQLGIILANAELLESMSAEPSNRVRAAQIVAGALDALGTLKAIRSHQNRTSASNL